MKKCRPRLDRPAKKRARSEKKNGSKRGAPWRGWGSGEGESYARENDTAGSTVCNALKNKAKKGTKRGSKGKKGSGGGRSF